MSEELPIASTEAKQATLGIATKPKKTKKEVITPVLTENALKVIEKRYLKRDDENNIVETPEGMFRRVAHHIAMADEMYGATKEEIAEVEEEFYEAMAKLEFLPNSPTFSGAGTRIGQLAACFVLPVEDNMKSILKTQMDMGLIQKSGGGTGFSFSKIRPKNDLVGSTGGIASGPVGFMQMFNDTTEMIKQGGIRRGANMGMLRVDHPDIMEFISYKETEGKLTTFNISVAITDKFMKAVEEDTNYDLINPHTGNKQGELNAREVFDKIVQGAWRNGEPGVIFIDKVNAKNPTPNLGDMEATNPCGEQPLLGYESCNLGSINIGRMVKKVDGKPEIDWETIEKTIRLASHFLDNVIDVNKFPIPELEENTKRTRKVGMGVMGLADLLFQMEIPYDSNEGMKIAEEVMKRLSKISHEESEKIGAARGNFPAFEGSMWDKKGVKNMRNAATSTIAPTGTISMMATASSGIEPIFALVYTKTVMDGTELVEVNRHFKKALEDAGIYSDDLLRRIAQAGGSVQKFTEVPEKIRRVFVTAGDISPEWHVKVQAACQKNTDNAISKTINFANSATIEDVEKAYLLAFKLNCKGITVYRDGSRNIQVITTGTAEDKKKEGETAEHTVLATGIRIIPRERPDVIHGSTYRLKTAYGKLFVTINDDEEGMPFEMFSTLGKTGGFFASNTEAICRLISLALRAGIDPQEVIDQIKGIRGPQPTWGEDGKMILSLPDAIGQLLERHINRSQPNLNLNFNTPEPQKISEEKVEENLESINPVTPTTSTKSLADLGEAPACQECGAMLAFTEGCLKCPSCGWSKCA
ncbi:MAG: vitamin B12-dependent ribonucleotide reductase [Candidatus Berkelbacteria bacterium]